MNTQEYISKNNQRFIDELLDFLRIPSVSTELEFKKNILDCAEFVKDKLVLAEADNVKIYSTKGHPVVYGEKIIDKNAPTVLVYGHYDVQPADPLDEWNSGPFDPIIKDEKIYARGACDDKGQMYAHIKAFETMTQTQNVPCNLKFIFEGEEENGSVNLEKFVKNNLEKLSADVVLISDTSMVANDVPSITVGLRGISYIEIEVTGPNRDLHSGVYGGAVDNPINVLCEMIAKLKDEKNKVTIPGFYEAVEEISSDEKDGYICIPFDEGKYKDDLCIGSLRVEDGCTPIEATCARPTLDVHGIWGGYSGEGAKTIIPSRASAKISMRLVPNQSSADITKRISEFLKEIAPPTVRIKIKEHNGGEPSVTPMQSVEYQAAKQAIEKSFGKTPIAVRCGGSIPVVATFQKYLGTQSVLMGFGLDSDNIHSPNECFGLFNYYKAIETIPYFYEYYAELKS